MITNRLETVRQIHDIVQDLPDEYGYIIKGFRNGDQAEVVRAIKNAPADMDLGRPIPVLGSLLTSAILYSYPDAANALLDRGYIDVNIKDGTGKSTIEYARMNPTPAMKGVLERMEALAGERTSGVKQSVPSAPGGEEEVEPEPAAAMRSPPPIHAEAMHRVYKTLRRGGRRRSRRRRSRRRRRRTRRR